MDDIIPRGWKAMPTIFNIARVNIVKPVYGRNNGNLFPKKAHKKNVRTVKEIVTIFTTLLLSCDPFKSSSLSLKFSINSLVISYLKMIFCSIFIEK